MKSSGVVFSSRSYIGSAEPPATVLEDTSRFGNDGAFLSAGNPDWIQLPSGFWVMDFDGSDYVDLGSTFQSLGRTSHSWEVWVKPDDGQPAGEEDFIGNQKAGNTEIWILSLTTAGKIQFQLRANNNDARALTNAAVFSDGQAPWTQIIPVADSTIGGVGGLVIYANGEVQALDAGINGDTSGITFADFTPADNLYIGAKNNNGTDQFHLNGLMVSIRFIQYAVSAEEAAARFQANRHWFGV